MIALSVLSDMKQCLEATFVRAPTAVSSPSGALRENGRVRAVFYFVAPPQAKADVSSWPSASAFEGPLFGR
jgi:hypothetical protein